MFDEDIFFIKVNGEKRGLNDIIIENIDKNIKAHYNNLTQVTDFSQGSEAYHNVVQQSQIQYDLEERINEVDKNNMPFYMEGEYLDNFGGSIGVNRVKSQASEGKISIKKKKVSDDGIITIPVNTLVSTTDGVVFTTKEEIRINNSDDNIIVGVISDMPGEEGNVLKGTVNIFLDDYLNDNLSVNNNENFTGGVDEEEDDTYRFKIISSVNNYAVGTKLWYESLIGKIDGIRDVLYNNSPKNKPGEVEIIFKPYKKDEVSIIESKIRSIFRKDEYNILGIYINIKTPPTRKISPYIRIKKNNMRVFEDVKNDIVEKIASMIDELKIGENIDKYEIEKEIGLVDGVLEAEISLNDLILNENEILNVNKEELGNNIKEN